MKCGFTTKKAMLAAAVGHGMKANVSIGIRRNSTEPSAVAPDATANME
jgi:hypothetical protein